MVERTYTITTTGGTGSAIDLGTVVWDKVTDEPVDGWYDPDSLKGLTPRKTDTISARVKVHKATLAERDKAAVMHSIKAKLVKKMMEQLEHRLKVTHTVNPKSGAVTFEATLEVYEDET